jgi:hypothetical protein
MVFVRLSADTSDITARVKHAAINWCDCYNGRNETVANSPIVPVDEAQPHDSTAIVAIRNLSIPDYMATNASAP